MSKIIQTIPDIRPLGPSGTFLVAQPATAKGFVWVAIPLPTGFSSLSNITITAATSGQELAYNGSSWVNITPIDVSGYAAIQNSGTFLTLRPTLNFASTGINVKDGPGNITTIYLSKNLESLSPLANYGIITQSGVGTFATISLTSGSNRISILNPSGLGGNPTIDVVENKLVLNNQSGILSIVHGGTSMDDVGGPNTLLGVDSIASTLEYKNLGSSDGTVTLNHSLQTIDVLVTTGSIPLKNFSGTLPVNKGGTGRTSLTANSVLIGNDTGAIYNSAALYYDPAIGKLGVGSIAPSAYLHILSAVNPVISLSDMTSYTTVFNRHTLNYDGNFLYFTDKNSITNKIATTGNSIIDFMGTLPLSRGGTGQTAIASGTLLMSNGVKIVPLTGIGTNEIATWNGSIWTSSTGSYVTLSPTTFGRNAITAQASSVLPLVIVGANNHATGLFAIYDSNIRLLFYINNIGQAYVDNFTTINNNLFVSGVITANKVGGAISIASGSNTIPSLWTLNQALQGINFNSSQGIDIRDLNGHKLITFNTSGTVIRTHYGLILSSGSNNTTLINAGSGNTIIFPTGDGTLALTSQLGGGSWGYGGISVSGGLLSYNNTTGIMSLSSGVISSLLPQYVSGTILTNNGVNNVWSSGFTFATSGLQIQNTSGTFKTTVICGPITANRNIVLPNSSDTLAGYATTGLWSAQQIYVDNNLLLRNPAATFTSTIKAGAQTGNRIFTFPVVSANTTIAVLNASQTFTGTNIFNNDVTFGANIIFISSQNITSPGLTFVPVDNVTIPLLVKSVSSPTVDLLQIQDSAGNPISSFGPNGDIKTLSAGVGFYCKEGSNACMGTSTLTAGTVVVSNTKVTANSRIFLTINGGSLVNVGTPYVSSRTAGTSFTISSTNVLDASSIAWLIMEPS